jgi:sarcosine oxidase, subunit alpha
MEPGRSRYLLALDEAGYVMDDGLISALEDGSWYLTSTSGGADRMEAWLRDWADRWDLRVHIVNQTAMTGAINLAGPRARELLRSISGDDVSAAAISYPGHGLIAIGDIVCRAVRVGFVGELSFELHHQRSRSFELWEKIMAAGEAMGIRPHGLDALDLLRLEKGHIYLGQDTLPDDHPAKLGLGWAVARDKTFLGRTALERMAQLPLERKLFGLGFDGPPQRGMPLSVDGRVIGRVTSCARSEALDTWIGLGWVRAVDGGFPTAMTSGEVSAKVVATPFYDPTGERMRA